MTGRRIAVVGGGVSGITAGYVLSRTDRVTLFEAYAYAYTRTIAATVSTLWGTQHPSYDYRLSGTGDLILTTLTREHQGISFARQRGQDQVAGA